MLTHAFEEVWDIVRQRNVTPRIAAFMLGIERVRIATQLAGVN